MKKELIKSITDPFFIISWSLMTLVLTYLFRHWDESLSSVITIVFTLLIFTVFLVSRARHFSLHTILNSCFIDVSNVLRNTTTATIYDNYEDIKNDLNMIELFNVQWKEFAECLYFDKKNHRIYNTVNPREFLDYDSLIENHVNPTTFISIPPILTGLGILGTFIGLALGLIGFETGSSSEMESSIKLLLGGMWTAFLTSIIGISSSILLTWAFNHTQTKTSKLHLELIGKIDSLFIRTTESDELNRIRLIADSQLTELKDLGNKLVEPLENALSKAVSQSISPILTSLNDSISNLNLNLSSWVSKDIAPVLSELKNAINKLIEHRMENIDSSLKKMIEEFMNRLSGQSLKQTERLSSVLEKAANNMETASEKINNTLSHIENSSDKQKETINSTVEGLSSLKEILNDFRIVSDSMNKQSETFSKTGESNLEIMSKLQNAGNEAKSTISSLSNTTALFESNINNLLEITIKQTKLAEKFDGIATSSESMIESFNITVATMKTYHEQFNEEIRNQITAAEKFKEVINNSSKLSEGIKDAAEEFTTAAGLMDEISGRIRDSSKSLDSSLSAQTTVTETFQGRVNELTNNINESTENAKELWDEHVQTFRILNEAINTGISNYTENVRKSLENILGQFDSQMSDAVNSFGNSIEALDDHFDSLNKMLETIHNKQSE
jgi:ABC-type transporter Mla subunit MlaD